MIIYRSYSIYVIVRSGLILKTKLSFTSSNSSFTECVRKKALNNPISNVYPTYKNCINNNGTITSCEGPDILSGRVISSSATFISCTFTSLTSSESGGAISFTHGDTLSVDQCAFTDCTSTHSVQHYEGGGGVFSNCGSLLSVTSSTFIRCTAVSFGGGVLATKDCNHATVSLCNFFTCSANHGGGLNLFFGPSSSISSSCFFSCTADAVGGGLYHDSKTSCYITLSDLLFTGNTANNNGDRGGGGFEDYRSLTSYPISISFSFFKGNRAPKGVGNDVSICHRALGRNDIIHCFTATASNSFWNTHYNNLEWLPQANIKDKFTRLAKAQ